VVREPTVHALKAPLRNPRVEPYVSAMLRGRLVRESAAFALREMRHATSAHVYHIREGGLRALIAHGTPDVLTLDEIFYQHVYEPPVTVHSLLAGLGRPLRALDVGANVGLWGIWLHGHYAVSHITALEPDAENAAKHRRQIELNGLEDSWELVQAAATSTGGPVTFTVGQATTGHISEHGGPGTVVVDGHDVFSLLSDVDVLKLDIEGAEWPILLDPRFAETDVLVVVLEYHPEGAPSASPEKDARRALANAGFVSHTTHRTAAGPGVIWGYRR
jgi:FkbM family methyltransferase